MSLRPRTALLLIVASTLSIGLGSCGEDEPTPEEARLQRVEELFVAAYGEEDANCMLEQLDDETIAAFDGPGALPQGAALDDFTLIAQACILGEDGTIPGADASSSTVPTEGSTPAGDPAATPDPDATPSPGAGGDTTTTAPTGSEPTETTAGTPTTLDG